MEVISKNKGELIFRQGDPGDCMFEIRSGKVGIFLDYGGNSEVKLTELHAGQLLGEMGLLDQAPRSAAAVSLADDTELLRITEESFHRFFEEDPDKMLLLLQQMSARLRRISRDYADASRTVSEVLEAEKAGREKDQALKNRIAKTLAGYTAFGLESQAEEGSET